MKSSGSGHATDVDAPEDEIPKARDSRARRCSKGVKHCIAANTTQPTDRILRSRVIRGIGARVLMNDGNGLKKKRVALAGKRRADGQLPRKRAKKRTSCPESLSSDNHVYCLRLRRVLRTICPSPPRLPTWTRRTSLARRLCTRAMKVLFLPRLPVDHFGASSVKALDLCGKRSRRNVQSRGTVNGALRSSARETIGPADPASLESVASSASDLNDLSDLGCSLDRVDCLTREYNDPTTNLPVLEFTVYFGPLLFSFKTFVAPSGIPGGGNGAFIELMGAGVKKQTKWDFDPAIDAFEPNGNCIYLGRFGPMSERDRLPEDVFNVKSFIFSQEPDEWAFGVEELLQNEPQIVDITCHDTGEPSQAARKTIPMYVNEIGHTGKYEQNVWACSAKGRDIQFFFQGKLKKGEPVELLTNYGTLYERIRERKGYGLRNLWNGKPSDTDKVQRLRRGVEEREWVEDKIADVSIHRLMHLLEFVDESIWRPIAYSDNPLTPKQRVAAQRICWVAVHILQRAKQIGRDSSCRTKIEETVNFILTRADKRLSRLRFPIMVDDEGVEALEYENLEILCYGVRSQLPMVRDTADSCPITCGLVIELCNQLAPLHTFELTRDGKQKEKAVASFYAAAGKALSNFQTRSATKGRINYVVSIVDLFASSYLKESLYARCTLRKHLNAELLNRKVASFVAPGKVP